MAVVYTGIYANVPRQQFSSTAGAHNTRPASQIASAEYALAELPALNPKNRIAGTLPLRAGAAGRDRIMHTRLELE